MAGCMKSLAAFLIEEYNRGLVAVNIATVLCLAQVELGTSVHGGSQNWRLASDGNVGLVMS